MCAAAITDRDHETEWDPVPDTIVRLAIGHDREDNPEPGRTLDRSKTEEGDLTRSRRLDNLGPKLNTVHFTTLMAAAKSIRTVGCGARGRSG